MRARTRPGEAMLPTTAPTGKPTPLAVAEVSLARDHAEYLNARDRLREVLSADIPLEHGPGTDDRVALWADTIGVASRAVGIAAKTLRYSYRAARGLRTAAPATPAPAAPKGARGKGKAAP